MIALDSITKLNTTVFYVTNASESGLNMGLVLGVDVVGLSQFIDALEPVPLAGGVGLVSMRNQMAVAINPDRLEFRDGSGEIPVRPDFPERVARIAEHIARQSSQRYAAIGLTFDIEASPADGRLPSQAVLHRLGIGYVLENVGHNATGASVRVWYVAQDKQSARYDLRIEPRGNQQESLNYYAQLNVHMVLGGEGPSPQWLSQVLQEEYRDFVRVLAEILDTRKEHLR